MKHGIITIYVMHPYKMVRMSLGKLIGFIN